MPNPVINRRLVAVNAQGLTARTADWVRRVIKNGGARPSANTIQAANAWNLRLINSGLDLSIIEANFFAPDSLIASLTPFYVQTAGGANDPWVNHNFVAGDLTVNGLIGNGSSKFLDTGLAPTLFFPSINNFGISYYIHTSSADNASDGGVDIGGAGHVSMYGDFGNLVIAQMGNNTSDSISWSQALWQGFVSSSRSSATQIDLYTANSVTAFSKVATTSSGSGGNSPNIPLFVFAINNTGVAGGFSAKRLSFKAYHFAFTQTQTSMLFDATQKLRQAFGGGFR